MISKKSNALEEGLICVLLVSMTLLVFTEVISRFVFNAGHMWMEEATLTCGAWFVLFGMSYGVKVGAHIGVDAFVKSLPPQARKITSIAAVIICLCYCAMFFYGSMVYLSKMYSIGLVMEDIHVPAFIANSMSEDTAWDVFRIDAEDPLMPVWIMQSILLFGFGLLFYRFSQLLIKIIQGKADGFKFADEAEESMHLIQEESEQVESSEQEASSQEQSEKESTQKESAQQESTQQQDSHQDITWQEVTPQEAAEKESTQEKNTTKEAK